MRIAGALASHRTLAAKIKRAERVDLTRVLNADNHAELSLHGRIRQRGLHSPQIQGSASILVDIR